MKKIIYMVATVVLISVISIGLFEFYQNWRNDRTEDRVNNPFRESDAEDLNKVSSKKGKVKDFTTAELKYGATMLEYLKLIESEQAELDDLFIFIQESPEVLENRNLTDELAMMVGTIDSLVSEVSNLEIPSDDVARISHSIIEYAKIRKELTELYYDVFGYYEEVNARKIIELEELSTDLLEKYKKKATLLFDASRSYDGPLDELQEKQTETETEEPGTELNEVKRNSSNPKHFVRDRRFGNSESNFEIGEDSDEIEIILEMIREFFNHEFNDQVDTWYSENTNQFIIHSTNSLLEDQYFEAMTNGNPNPITEWEYTTIHLSKRIQSLTATDYTVALQDPTDSDYVLFEARNGQPIYNYFKDSDYQENY